MIQKNIKEIADGNGLVYVSDTRLSGATREDFLHWYNDIYSKLTS